jgi:hypothetical protein
MRGRLHVKKAVTHPGDASENAVMDWLYAMGRRWWIAIGRGYDGSGENPKNAKKR